MQGNSFFVPTKSINQDARAGYNSLSVMNFSILGDLSLCFQERVSLIPVRILLIVDAKRKGRVIELEGMGAKKILAGRN